MDNGTEHRIIELIGDRKYHSAFLTTYSFDFAFFETTVMRQLKGAHLENINVLVDKFLLHDSLGIYTGAAKGISRGYSIIGIEGQAVFHPKTHLFLGEKQGAVIIGSGNITSSGFGRNREIWGAFHIDGPKDPKAPLFLKLWDYIKLKISNTRGFVKKRVDFAQDNAKWIEKINKAYDFVSIDNDIFLKVLINDKDEGRIINQLTDSIEHTITECSIYSPYYDRNLSLLNKLYKNYPSASFKVIMPQEGNLLPDSYPGHLNNKLTFHRWDSVFEDDRRLMHSKFYHFKTENDTEYLLVGSSNATPAGFGYGKKINDEINYLIKTSKNKLITKLNIPDKIPKTKFTDFIRLRDPTEQAESIQRVSFSVKLNGVDRDQNKYYLFIDGDIPKEGMEARLFDSHGEEIGAFSVIRKKDSYSFNSGKAIINNALYAQLFVNQKEISDKQIIQDVYELAKGNPSKESRELNELLAKLQLDGDDLTQLIDYVILDDEDFEKERISHERNASILVENNPDEKDNNEYKKLSYEELIEEDKDQFQRHFQKFHDSNYRIVDFLLNYLEDKKLSSQEIIDENEEETGSPDKSFDPEENEPKSSQSKKIRSKSEYELIAGRLKKHLEKYRKQLREKASNPDTVPNLRDYSRFVIATQFLILYGGRVAKVREKIEIFSKEVNDYVLTEEINHYSFVDWKGELGKSNFKSFVIDIVGDFLWLVLKGKRNDNINILEGMERLEKASITNALFCIGALTWKDIFEEFDKLREVLFLNTLEYLANSDVGIMEENEINKQLNLLFKKAGNKSRDVFENLFSLFDVLSPSYIKFHQEMNKKISNRNNIKEISELKSGDIVFRSNYGFCSIHKIKRIKDENPGIILFRPGLHDKYGDNPFLSEELPITKLITLIN